MPRYEFSEGSSNKFWEITLKDNEVITHYGRIGADGQSTNKTFGSAADAKSAYDKLIAEKTKKGYVLKGGGAASAPVTAAAPAKSAAPAKAAAAGANPLITRLDAWLKKIRPKYYAKLNPGASPAEIEKLEKQIGDLPQTLKDLLLWRNGQSSSSRLLDNWGLMSARQIGSAWLGMKKMKENDELESEDLWDLAWVPFLENGGGDNLCIDLKKKGAIREFWHADEDRNVIYPSIDKLLTEYLSSVEKGHWALEDTGVFSWGDEIEPSDDLNEVVGDDDDKEKEMPKSVEPSLPVGKAVTNLKSQRLLKVPEEAKRGGADLSPDGKHTVYSISEKKRERFVYDGKEGPWFELMLGPWFDEATGILVYKEGKPRKFRWHIGEDQVHDYYDMSDNPVFTPDGKRNCYEAMKSKKGFLVVDGVAQKETFDRILNPVWSPDGSKIAFIAEIGGKRYVFDNGVRGPECIEPRDLVYSPDSSKLAYCVTKSKTGWQYQIWCGDYKSDVLGLATKPAFSPTGELWFSFTTPHPNHGYGFCIGKKTIKTERSVDDAFFLPDGTLAGHIESEDRRSFLIRPGKDAVELPCYNEGLFHAPDTFVIHANRRTQQQNMNNFYGRDVICVNGRETGEYDKISKLRLSADGKTITFGAMKDGELLFVEMPV